MHLLLFVSLSISTTLALPRRNTWIPGPTTGTDLLAKEGFAKLATFLQTNSSVQESHGNCTLENAHRRKEWDALIPDEKREWIKAVQCLQTLPATSDPNEFPGARTRYDDFVGEHLNKTAAAWSIHMTGNFLTWHRYYLWKWEEALRNECNYTGNHPYVNFGRYSNDVLGAPLFDGSDTSISGNGLDSPHTDLVLNATTRNPNKVVVTIPAAPNGGGCVTDGPFANYTINLGPVNLVSKFNPAVPENPLKSGKGYNPRCLTRALNIVSASGCSDANSTKLILNNSEIGPFQDELSSPSSYGVSEYGVHGAAHYIANGDPGGDDFTSPGDPFFWLLHAQVDRLWWIWQIQDFGARVGQIAGTMTMFDNPPSRNLTLDDIVELGYIDGGKGFKVRELVDTMAGPFCYIYE